MSASLKFWMTDGLNPEVYKIEFIDSVNGEPRISARGNTSGAYFGAGSFRWSSAVQALTVLGIECAEISARGTSQKVVISGTRGSGAASLDYAIGKNTNWLHELFGEDASGRPLCRQIFKRSNPELRRSGPAEVSFNPSLIAPDGIKIFVENELCTDPERLREMSQSVKSQKKPKVESSESPKRVDHSRRAAAPLISARKFLDEQQVRGPLPFPFRDQHNRDQLKAIFRSEVLSMLYSTNIFNRWDLDKAEARIKGNQTYRDLTGPYADTPIVSDIDRGLLSADRLGVSRNGQSLLPGPDDAPIRCYVPVVEITTLSLLYYIKFINGINLDITFGYSHSRMLLNELRLGQLDPEPDVMFMAIGPAAGLIGLGEKTGFSPLMLMPRITYRIAAPAGNIYAEDAPRYGTYLFMNDQPTSPQYYFNSLAEEGFFYEGRVDVLNMEPHEVTSAFRSGDPELRAIMWWPHHTLTKIFGNSVIFEDIASEMSNIDTICFASKKMQENPPVLRALDIAIRDAWLRLMDEGPSLDLVLDLLVENRDYVRFLKRISGMHYLFPPEKDIDTELQIALPQMKKVGGYP
ncbi:MAG: hypothetical protein KDD66_00740 [Bdellovibrionales bacterium]|nr:hypothetical protein [Bdellovibrionales bacterium]